MLPVVMAFSWLVPERKVRRSLAMFLALLLAAAVQAANTWHVDAKLGKDTGSGSTRGDAKQSIQAAIDAAAEGDTILVDDGIYSPIQTADKDIAIRSVNGAQTTIIDGGKAERCATLGGPGSAQNTVLDGFTLRNGYAAEGEGGGAYGGTLINCILVDNAAPLGDDGVASHGGGAYKCTLTNCTLTRNQADLGGGAHSCTLTNCILTGNQATEYGGGVYNGYALINCILSENMAEEGGGAYWCGLRNCTVTGNSAARGGGVVGCSLENSIVWDNFAPEGPNYPEPGDDDSWFDYSCTEPLPEDGTGNISADPKFVDAENGDYHLSPGSPCIDAGNNDVVQVETDLAGNPRISNETVDMGAYEGSIEGFVIFGRIQGKGLLAPMTAVVLPGGSATFTATENHGSFRHFEIDGVAVSESPSYTWENIQADGVITAVFDPLTWYVDDDLDGDGTSWENALPSIQAAIDVAADGDTILVNDGFYAPIVTRNRAITIRSRNGAGKTVIDGGGVKRCATLGAYTFERNTILAGFTLQNGYAECGGGVYGGTLTNCALTGNEAEIDGGGVYGGTLTNCILTGNSTYDWGGGACGSTLHNCLLAGNSSAAKGGGAYYSFMTNCLLIDNFARLGGGASDSTLRNCTLASNEAWQQGGGAYDCALANSIIWGNTAPKDENCYVADDDDDGEEGDEPEPGDDAGLVYCCTTPLADGQGNIDVAPLFVDPVNGDCRLRAGSPCVDAGDTALVSGDDEIDLAGNPRISNGAVDMGAYEGVVSGFVISGSVEGHGQISPPNAVVSAGGNVTFEARESGRVFSHFLVNGERVPGSAKTYTFTDIQADAEIAVVFENKIWYVDVNNGNDEGTGLSWDDAKWSIQAAVNEAVDGDVIEVAEGDYQPIDTDNKAIVIRSVLGSEKTSISGEEYKRCATLCNGFSKPKTVLIGFALQKGIMEKTAQEIVDGELTEIYYFGDGGGAHGGTLINCHLLNNSASYGGGAAYSTLIDCQLTGNHASRGFVDSDAGGGGAYMCVLNNCELRENSAERSGGGAHDCRLTNCALYGNWTNSSGGGAAYSVLSNCALAFNRAAEYGGGVGEDSSMINCTLTENEARWGGGVDPDGRGLVVNCIIWGNWAYEAGDNYYVFEHDHSVASFLYSCTDPLPEGEGNICADPLFVDAEAGDFRLSTESPCIDAGSNAFAVGDVDLVGNPRILYGVVDMGAFEFTSMSALPGGKYAWQSGWNTLYLPFDSIESATAEALAGMPVFRLSANTNVQDTAVSLHTPLWIFCFDPKFAPVLRGILTPGAPPDPLAIPAGQWTPVGAQRQVETLPDGYAAWEWRTRRYVRVQSLQAGRVYFIYRSNTP